MNPSRLTRRLLAGAAGLALGLAGTLALASPASAHHTEIVGTPECVTETGEWLVTWTVNSAATPPEVDQYQLTAVEHQPGDSTVTGLTLNTEQSITEPFTGEQRLPGDATSAALTVHAKWDNGHTNTSVSDPVMFDGTCDKAEPPVDDKPGEFTFDCEALTITFTNPTEEELAVTFLPSTGDAVEVTVAAGETGEAEFPASEGLSVEVQVGGETVPLTEPIEITSEEWAELNCDEDGGGQGGGDDDDTGLPVTGSSTALIAGGALALLALGGGLYLVARRRRVTFTA